MSDKYIEVMYKCDVCSSPMKFHEYYNRTDNLKFKPNIILTICNSCSNKIKDFIVNLKGSEL